LLVIAASFLALSFPLAAAMQTPTPQAPAGPAPGAGGSTPQAPLPEGYVRLTQPEPATAKGNTTQSLVSTGKVYQVGFRTGDEVMSGLTDWARKNKITSGYITGVGGFISATFGWIDPEVRGGLRKIEVREKVEVTSFVGNFTPGQDGRTNIHIHALVTGGDGIARGGHLISAQVNPIMDLFVTEFAPAGAPQVPEGR
jgi:predicted DNA-binding protein with PD1-like motif